MVNIFYNICSKNIKLLDQSLNSLINQTNKNFKLTILLNIEDEKIINFIKNYSFSNINEINFVKTNKTVPLSNIFDLSSQNDSYIVFSDQCTIFKNKFIEKLINACKNNDDIISFIPGNSKTITQDTLTNNNILNISMYAFNIAFLKKYSISFQENNYFPFLFLFKAIKNFTTWTNIQEKLSNYTFDNIYSQYSLNNFFSELSIFISNYNESNIWKKTPEYFEFFFITLNCFYYLVLVNQLQKKQFQYDSAAISTINFLYSYNKRWEKNEFLNKYLKKKEISNKNIYEIAKNILQQIYE